MYGLRLHRRLAAFLLINAVALNLGLAWADSSATGLRSKRPTSLHFSLDYLRRVAGSDSWTPMRRALAYLHEPHATPLHSEPFFRPSGTVPIGRTAGRGKV